MKCFQMFHATGRRCNLYFAAILLFFPHAHSLRADEPSQNIEGAATSASADPLPSLPDVTPANSSLINRRPVMLLNNHYYTFYDMTGMTTTDFLNQVETEEDSLSDAQLKADIASWWNLATEDRLQLQKTDLSRTDLEKRFGEMAYVSVLQQALFDLAPGAVVDNILATQHFSLDSYFNIQLLTDYAAKQLQYDTFLDVNAGSSPQQRVALYQEALDRYNIKPSFANFNGDLDDELSAPSYLKLRTSVFSNDRSLIKCLVKSALLSDLLGATCDHGAYFHRAKDYVIFQHSYFNVVDISNYRGDPTVLQSFLLNLVGSGKAITLGGLVPLRIWLGKCSSHVAVSAQNTSGMTLTSGFAVPPMNELVRQTDGSFRFIAPSVNDVQPPDHQLTPMDINLCKIYASQMAVSDYAPNFQSLVPNWQPDISLCDQPFSSVVKDLCPSQQPPNYLIRPYPADVFDDFVSNSEPMQTAAVRAAALAITEDAKAKKSLIERLTALKSAAESSTVKNMYELLLNDLEHPSSTGSH